MYFKFDKKMTQTVAFGVTSQKEFLYNALESWRLNWYEFKFVVLTYCILSFCEFIPITPQPTV
ncbi:conserved hypothetical protein [Vibrio aestuarianus]|nr:conserved hypothetical protein [Vibrio aestuarianus subsp. francensis]CAH8206433.1 conserved hypothetical protein [Vibrio aestuarianus]CAH8206461.1 conserved hypothetical protein [Vibrio aestuarianus]CAH8206598.1 conserved hypothetical protein [Vibrio aestuarianus]CAH8206754.1 conserved hypothetical protein [Vibrio aestuarianus]